MGKDGKAQKKSVKASNAGTGKGGADTAATAAAKSTASSSSQTPWACITLFAGSGMVQEYKLCVTEVEYTKSYRALSPHVGDYWGCFKKLAMCPVLGLDEATRFFDNVIGDAAQGETTEDIIEKVCEKSSEVEARYAQASNEQKTTHAMSSWVTHAERDVAQAAKALEDLYVFDLGFFLKNEGSWYGSELVVLLSSEADRKALAAHAAGRFKIEEEDANERFWYDNGISVITYDAVKKQVDEEDLGEWG